MKTIQFNQAGVATDVLFCRDSEKPPLTSHNVLVKVMARPLNPSDYMFIQGEYRLKPVFPQIAGLEGSGIIEAVGDSVNEFKAGDHVAFRSVGTWAEYTVVKPESLIKVDRAIPFEASSQLALNPVTAFALLEQSAVQSGDYLLLSAATSALCALIIQLAKQKGVHTICLVRDLRQTEALLQLGSVAVIDQARVDLSARITELTGEVGVAAFLDAVGGPLLTSCIQVMRPLGRIILYGRYDSSPAALFNGDVIYRNLTIVGFGIAQWLSEQSVARKNEVFRLLIDHIADRTLLLPAAHVYKLDDFKQALAVDLRKTSGKVILTNSSESSELVN